MLALYCSGTSVELDRIYSSKADDIMIHPVAYYFSIFLYTFF